MNRLFRKEVVEARRNQWLGTVSIAQGPKTWVFGALALVAALLVVALLCFGEYTRRTRVVGQITPSSGLVVIQAPTSGVISKVRVAEGDRVEEGNALARIDVPSATGDESSTSRAVGAAIADRAIAITESYAAQRSQLASRETSLAQQRNGLDSELAALAAELEERQAQLVLSEENEARFANLRNRQFVTDSQWQQQKSQVLEQRVSIQRIRRDIAQLRRQLAVLSQEQVSLPDQIDALIAAEARDRASLGQERLEATRRNESVVTAPVGGTVTALLGLAGQSVQTGQTVMTLLPDGANLEAHLFVPSRAVGFVAPGDAVLLRFHSFPYQKFGQGLGEVVRVSRSALSGPELASIAAQGATPEPLYRVVVRLERDSVRAFGQDEPLRPGMMLEADVLGERRKLWEWLLEPVFSISGRTIN